MILVHTLMAGKQVMEAYVQLHIIVLKDQKHHYPVLQGPTAPSQSLQCVHPV